MFDRRRAGSSGQFASTLARPTGLVSFSVASGPAQPVRSRFAPVAAGLLALWMAVAVLSPFVPALPQSGLDASWVATMGEAADRPLRWGVDIAFTYGPASPLVTLYGNAAYLSHTLPLLLAIALLFAACAVTLADHASGRPSSAAVLITLGLIGAQGGGIRDALFLALPLLPVLLRLSPGAAGRYGALLAVMMAAAVGATGAAKLSFLPGALLMFVVTDVASLAHRRMPLLAVPFVASFVLADVAYGQSLVDLPAFLRLGGEVVVGYSEAMASDGSRRELVAFAAAVAALLAVAALAERRDPDPARRAPVTLPLCVGAALFMMFKAGFVRHDLHSLIAWNGLALVAALVVLARGRQWPSPAVRTVLALALGGSVVVNAGTAAWTANPPGGFRAALEFERNRLLIGPFDQGKAAIALAADPAGAASGLNENRAEAWRAVGESDQLPTLSGSVDTIPSVQSAVIGGGLDYRPRPSFQEYSTYTEGLAVANRDFVEGPRAPDWILFGPEPVSGALSIDARYPNFAEGALWPDLLRLYQPERRAGPLLVLHRRASPADLILGEPRTRAANLDDEIPIDGDAPVFAVIDVRPTVLGRLAGLLFRPAPLVMMLRFADGHRQAYQFISGIGRSGFVISPLVTDADTFAELAAATPAPVDRRVVSLTLLAPPKLRWLVSTAVAVTLRTMTLDSAVRP